MADPPGPLTRRQQNAFLKLAALGGSPAAVCQKLGLELEQVSRTLAADSEFRRRTEDVRRTQYENVRAALYRSAMEGNVSAQTLFIRLEQAAPEAAADTGPAGDDLENLSDAELLSLFERLSVLKTEAEQLTASVDAHRA
ncbi:MAG: hypothetical protein KF774_10895 [Planctomyces sp.]|nr:hypothetical protein [Planctomyces sp.]